MKLCVILIDGDTCIYRNMNELDNKQKDVTDDETTKRIEQALKQDRLGVWPSIIGIGGTLGVFLNILFREWDAYINIGSVSIYLWELCLFFLAIAIAFVPASVKDARCLADEKQIPSVKSYTLGIIMRFLIAGTVLIIITKLL